MIYELSSLFSLLPQDVQEHGIRTGAYARILFQHSYRQQKKAYSKDDTLIQQAVQDGGKYHDIGKLAVSGLILHSDMQLSDTARKILSYHPDYAEYLLTQAPDFMAMPENYRKCVLEMCRYHHERWDGSGYPCGLKNNDIPFFAQLCSVADAFDAMTTNRSYRTAYTAENAYQTICDACGTQFSPDAVSALVSSKNFFLQHGTECIPDDFNYNDFKNEKCKV